MLAIHKARILRKKPLEKVFLNFKKWVKSIQTAGYSGAHTEIATVKQSKFRFSKRTKKNKEILHS